MTGSASGQVRTTLRLEGFCVFAVALLFHSRSGVGWGWFALFFLAPDLSFAGYLAGPRPGATIYNMAHSYIGPLIALAIGVLTSGPLATTAATIWLAHIGFDRALGYGLKYPSSFGDTHLGRIGRGS
ncbi:MAG TPA: DUF4260 domain-containing protein [Gemmatimonadales bacterium]|nr:DUF4260 domain-containing protein [Gemmatimonadales bacterium]